MLFTALPKYQVPTRSVPGSRVAQASLLDGEDEKGPGALADCKFSMSSVCEILGL